MAGWNFFNVFRGNIVKWWRLVILPVFRVNNNERKVSQSGESANGKEVESGQDTQKEAAKKEQQSVSTAKKKEKKDNSDTWWGEAMNNETDGDKDKLFSVDKYKASADKGDAMDILKRMELEKQKEMEELRRKAEEQERIDSILNANRKNVDEFIEEGRTQEEMRRAQEILDRLNREAAEDEAKKAAEIEAAKAQSQK